MSRPKASCESWYASVVFLAIVSRLFRYSWTREKCVFLVFNVADVTVFHILSFPSLSLSRTIFNPKHYFIPTPSFSRKFSAKSFQGMYFLHYSHLLFSNYAEFMLRVLKIGDFRKLGWISFSSEYFFKIFEWAVSHLLFVHLRWPLVAIWSCIEAFFHMFMHFS